MPRWILIITLRTDDRPSSMADTDINNFLKNCLPMLDEDEISKVLQALEDFGMTHIQDLQYLQPEKDLAGVINLLCCRMLSRKLQTVFQTTQEPIHEASGNNLSSHVTMEKTANAAATPTRKTVQSWAQKFQIPWDSLPEGVISACHNGQRPVKKDLLSMVRTLGAEITKHDQRPGKANLAVIAKKLVGKYPKSFADAIPGIGLIGDGSASLTERFRNFFDNVNRTNAGNNLRKLLMMDGCCSVDTDIGQNGDPENEKSKKRPLSVFARDSYGCVRWQPGDLPVDETEETQEQKRLWLIGEYPKVSQDVITVAAYMKVTYTSQRLAINKGASINVIKNLWPYLFIPKWLIMHFNNLMDCNLLETLDSQMEQRSNEIMSFIESHKNSSVAIAGKQLQLYSDMVGHSQPRKFGLILILPQIFEEEKDILFQTVEDTVTAVTLEREDLTGHPHIVISGSHPFNNNCHVMVEGCSVATGVDLRMAVATMIASYYCFNISYPSSVAATLEFIQRVLAGINPGRGTKAKGKRAKPGVNKKVLRLLNELRDFPGNSHWDII